MKMKKLWTSICFCLIFVVSGFPETVTLKTAGLDECIAVSSFIKNTESDFFLFSGKTNKIFKFDNKGNFIKSFCRSGEGPGEIRRVFSAFHNPANDYLYLPEYASNLARVSMFDKEGSFKGYMDVALSRKQKNNIQKLIFLKDGSFYAVISERVDWEPKGKIYVTKDRLTVFYFDKTQKNEN